MTLTLIVISSSNNRFQLQTICDNFINNL